MRKRRKKKEKPEQPGYFLYRESPPGKKEPYFREQEEMPEIWKKRIFFAGCLECYPGDRE